MFLYDLEYRVGAGIMLMTANLTLLKDLRSDDGWRDDAKRQSRQSHGKCQTEGCLKVTAFIGQKERRFRIKI
jgi:hypothetical protein